MKEYKTKASALHGKRYAELRWEAVQIFRELRRRTKRRPYIRSVYFNKQKIFFDYFWIHLFQKHPQERMRRLRYFAAAIELLRYSHHDPETVFSYNSPHEMLHRFAGRIKEGELFYVQVKEDKRSGKKYFMSCFPAR